MATTVEPSFLHRHSFLIYRLFSLSGLIPIGGYVIIHLLTNATLLDSAATFQKQVYAIHSLGVMLPVVEWLFIFLPMLFHAIVGFIVISTGLPNTGAYAYGSNIRYTLQRATGMIAFVFIVYHVAHMHYMFAPFREWGAAQFDAHHAASSAGEAVQRSLFTQIMYVIGILSAVYHLANGLWTFGITWGIWTTPRSQRRMSYVCGAFGVGLAIVGLGALAGVMTVDIEDARAIETRMQDEHIRSLGGEVPEIEDFATPSH